MLNFFSLQKGADGELVILGGFLLCALASATLLFCSPSAVAGDPGPGAENLEGVDPNGKVYYQIMVDRFNDGYGGNNLEPWYDGTHENWRMYWGGDLSGIEQKLDYLRDLGVSGMWMSPIVQNPMKLYYGTGNVTSYHGYHARDYKRIENRFSHYEEGWESFDNLVSSANENGIGVVVDFAPNHTNPIDSGIDGALYDNGDFVTDYASDNSNAHFDSVERSRQNYYHHNGRAENWDDRWEIRYKYIFDLADLNQSKEWVDRYLKDAASKFLARDIEGFRIDASKHMNQGWLKTFADNVYAQKSVFIMHEWYQGFGSDLYWDLAKFDNQSGMHELNIPLHFTIVNTFAGDSSLTTLDDRIHQQASEFKWNHKIVNFVDSHDEERFLNANDDNRMFEIANGFVLTAPGIPLIYYGTEQYLHSDEGSDDPYNRPMMKNWDRNTTMYHLIENLADLRKKNAALRYGLTSTRYVSSSESGTGKGVYVYERKFYDDVILVALSKCPQDVTLSDISTALPDGTYQDYLGGLLDGQSLSVSGGNVSSMNIPAKSFAVWHYTDPNPAKPEVGAINPTTARVGSRVRISGRGFGSTPGSVYLKSEEGEWPATVKAWTDNHVEFIVPGGAETSPGNQYLNVYVEDNTGENSNTIEFYYLSDEQVQVIHEVENTENTELETVPGESLFLTGNKSEYGNWSEDSSEALGPMYTPDWPDWFFTVSAPKSEKIQFKHIKAVPGEDGAWENGSNHVYTTPENGVVNEIVEAGGGPNYSPEITEVFASSAKSPDTFYSDNLQIRDNNLLSDVENVYFRVYENTVSWDSPDNLTNHYSFKWEAGTGFSEIGPGNGEHIDIEGSSRGDGEKTMDNWTFRIKLDQKTNFENDWSAWVKVEDSKGAQENGEYPNAFSIVPVVYPPGVQIVSMDENVNFGHITAGDTEKAKNNPFSATIRGENVSGVDLYVRGTDFTPVGGDPGIGVENVEHRPFDGSGSWGPLENTYQLLRGDLENNRNHTIRENFRISVPSGLVSEKTGFSGVLWCRVQENTLSPPG